MVYNKFKLHVHMYTSKKNVKDLEKDGPKER